MSANGGYGTWPPMPDWEPWFAWRPVRTLDGQRVWWRTIIRRPIGYHTAKLTGSGYEYGDPFLVAMQLPYGPKAPLLNSIEHDE